MSAHPANMLVTMKPVTLAFARTAFKEWAKGAHG